MPKLTVLQPDGTTIKYGLNGKSFTVGRAESNDIVIPGGSASNHHAVLKQGDSGDFVVTDFDSTNHTRVNGEIVQSRELQDGDEVQFGDISATYTSEIPSNSGKQPHRAAPAPVEDTEEDDLPPPTARPKAGSSVVKNPRPGARRAPGDMAPAPSASASTYSAGEGCFAMLMLILVAAGAFVLGLWLRHQKDHAGQSLPAYVAQWNLDQKKAEAAAEGKKLP